MSEFERLLEKIDASGDCWEWTAATNQRGYPLMKWRGKTDRPYRVMWKELVGPIPSGYEMDHLCRNRKCCNPDHLEPVTHLENMRRSVPAGTRKTECPKGHPYAGENLMVKVSPAGVRRRHCRKCERARWRNWYAKQKAATSG